MHTCMNHPQTMHARDNYSSMFQTLVMPYRNWIDENLVIHYNINIASFQVIGLGKQAGNR